MDPVLRLIIIIVQSYLIGSIPNALIIGKRFFGIDVRTVGSGNMGSTNVFRTLGWKAGIAVQLLDIAKGLVAVLLVAYFFDSEMPFVNRTPFEDETIVGLIAGFSAVVGHMFSFMAGFKGGKGMNTSLGMLIAVAPVEVAVGLGIFLVILFASGYVSLGSIAAAVIIPSTMAFRYNVLGVSIEGYHTLVVVLIALSSLVIYAHRSNVKRLIAGTENRFQKLMLFKRPAKS
ncbi:MAG: glycerol-3-phosphate 1-O-acyltransferase PlsY [Ignavibacteria bacterium]|nr:glycerol-3-phosphate 1-O-acyltransferase PlsY [Ignavibacteria bacterium]MBK7186898.1 glycerol-3-phosphate 1-O-acyltransferase PlsY [Ignavibacteria bacterium]MBK7577245.1 glycerol-3-phosphate 1-O-acyltransferase PlsY [Ignavibacteria bacterium]MBK9183125.1 glycerol-3-phosphate 1-O-acyltransferase PlsY [Ignavibacteria bacterium]MBL0322721.1 glycerol-3-phosphate 1-O-acyltransferase PlsY [Ignavibacteria bacterium]